MLTELYRRKMTTLEKFLYQELVKSLVKNHPLDVWALRRDLKYCRLISQLERASILRREK